MKEGKALQVPVRAVAWGRGAIGRFLCSQCKGSQVHWQEGTSGLSQPNLLPKAESATGPDQPGQGFVQSGLENLQGWSLFHSLRVISLPPASHRYWYYFKGTVLGILFPYLSHVEKLHKSPNDQPGAGIKGPHKNAMLHFCPRVSSCKRLCCCKRNVGFT